MRKIDLNKRKIVEDVLFKKYRIDIKDLNEKKWIIGRLEFLEKNSGHATKMDIGDYGFYRINSYNDDLLGEVKYNLGSHGKMDSIEDLAIFFKDKSTLEKISMLLSD